MANNTGLTFDPNRTINNNTDYKQSVPTVASDYLNQASPTIPPVKWNPNALKQAKEFVNWTNTATPEEKEQKYKEEDPLYTLDIWKKGLQGLDSEDLEAWELSNAKTVQGKSDKWKDRLWRNQVYADVLGLDAFYQTPNAEERDKQMESYLLNGAVMKKFGDNSNLRSIMELTPEGKKELLESDYKSDLQMERQKEHEQDKDWSDFTLEERLKAIDATTVTHGLSGAFLGSQLGGVAGTFGSFGFGTGAGFFGGGVIGALAGASTGSLIGFLDPRYGLLLGSEKAKEENNKILENIIALDNERKKENAAALTQELKQQYLSQLASGQDIEGKTPSQYFDDKYDDIALSQKKTIGDGKDELGNSNEYDYVGSTYYSAFKDTDVFEHFDTKDKIKYIAQTEALEQLYGKDIALQVLDQDMQNYISDKQTKLTWLANDLKNVWVGGLANLGMTVSGLGALNAKLFYGDEGLNNYLQGKNPDGSGRELRKIWNPKYWNKVDQYNTLGLSGDDLYDFIPQFIKDFVGEDLMDKADQFGGLSTENNVYKVGEENNIFGWPTINEAIKMSKFAWSEYMKNVALAGGLKKLVGAANGIEIAPGVLASESSAVAKGLNTAGQAGIFLGSSIGIDAAYGMQTYEEVYNKNMERLNNVKDIDVAEELEKRLQSPETREEFERLVKAENDRRRQSVGERGSYVLVDEEKAWEQYEEHLRAQIEEEYKQSEKYKNDAKQAELEAANAYATDATIEFLRMSAGNAAFRNFLFDKGTLNALGLNNPYVNTTYRNGYLALQKNAVLKKASGEMLGTVWGGFHSNYYDDVTVAYAEALGIQNYNNYLAQKYNPAAYGSVLDDYVSPFIMGVLGIEKGSLAKRSVIDGVVGGIGPFTMIAPNRSMLSHTENMAKVEKMVENAKKEGYQISKRSGIENAADFINNPIIQAIAKAKEDSRMTQIEIYERNKQLKEHGYALDNMTETLSAMNTKNAARQGTSIIDAEDAKDREAFAVATTLIDLKNSQAFSQAQSDPNKAEWGKMKRISAATANALNDFLGSTIFNTPETQYTRAMQTLEDAAAIGEAKNDAQIERQKELVRTFVGLDMNKNAMKDMTAEQKVEFAQERLKKNATRLLDMIDKTEKIYHATQQSYSLNGNFSDPLIKQLTYQFVLDPRWKERLAELNEMIAGKEVSEYEGGDNILIAKYGSEKGHQKAVESQKKKIESLKKDVEILSKRLEKGVYSLAGGLRKSMAAYAKIGRAKKNKQKAVEAQEAILNQMLEDGEKLKKLNESGEAVIQAEDILRLNPDDRLRMLDDFYRNDYSEKQQAEIDKAKNLIVERGISLTEAMQWVKDASTLNHRIKDNIEAAKSIMDNPALAIAWQRQLERNRQNKVIEYLNDKIVLEAFQEIINDKETLISKDALIAKLDKYSSAVLNLMARHIDRELKLTKKETDISQKTLTDITDAIYSIMGKRIKKAGDTVGLDEFLTRTDKVAHTETVINSEEGKTPIESQVTSDKELTLNDKRLLEYALDFIAERDKTVDDLEEVVGTEEFSNYVDERNHSFGGVDENGNLTNVVTVENQATLLPKENMQSLVRDVLSAYNENKAKAEEAKKSKETAPTPESVTTAPVNPTVTTEEKPEEEKPENEKENNNRQGEEKEGENAELINEIIQRGKNDSIIGDIEFLLKEVDKLETSDDIKDILKELIREQASNISFDNVKALQRKVWNESAFVENTPEDLQIFAKRLMDVDIEKQRNIESEKAEKETVVEKIMFKDPSVITLETRDLDYLDSDKYPHWKRFIETYKIGAVLQKLSDLWTKSRESYEGIHKIEVMFAVDPLVERQTIDAIGEDKYNRSMDAPVLMVVKIGEAQAENPEKIDITKTGTGKETNSAILEFRQSVIDSGHPLIQVRSVRDNKTIEFYQPIGVMPASQVSTNSNRESEAMMETAKYMGAIRDRIEYSEKDYKGKQSGPYLLRLAPSSGKGNGTPIKGSIHKVTHNASKSSENTDMSSRNDLTVLMDENVNSRDSFVAASKEEVEEYEKAKKKGLSFLRNNDLYKRIKKEVIKRLTPVKKESESLYETDRTYFTFRTAKGSNNEVKKPVMVKAIKDTASRNDPSRNIIDIVREINDNPSSESILVDLNKAQELINSNSRFKRLFDKLHNLKLEGLFNNSGVKVNGYDEMVNTFTNNVEKAVGNNLNIAKKLNVEYKTEIRDTPNGKVVDVNVYADGGYLSTLSIPYGKSLVETDYATFIKHLILDDDGNVRISPTNKNFDQIKWQVTYDEAVKANDENATESEKTMAIENLSDIYDDNILEMSVNSLYYPASSVVVKSNEGGNIASLYQDKITSESKPTIVTETKTAFEAETKNGEKIDADSGMLLEKAMEEKRQAIWNALPKHIVNAINKLLEESRIFDTDSSNKNYYKDTTSTSENPDIWVRMTSIKYAMPGMGKRYEENPSSTPSTALGNTADEFGRDVLNGKFVGMTIEQKKEKFAEYPNSTVENFMDLYEYFKSFEARLLAKGEIIIRTNYKDEDGEHPGKITPRGELEVTINVDGKLQKKKIKTAGTLDIITIDDTPEHNLRIYDFKTHHNTTLTLEEAIDGEHGYDRQVSGYGIMTESSMARLGWEDAKVVEAFLMPITDKYETPRNAEDYKLERPGSNQLLKKEKGHGGDTYRRFKEAGFKGEKEFKVPLLRGDELAASFEKMTEDEKAAIIDIIEEQSEDPTVTNLKTEDIKNVEIEKPKVEEEQLAVEEEGLEISEKQKKALSALLEDEDEDSGTIDLQKKRVSLKGKAVSEDLKSIKANKWNLPERIKEIVSQKLEKYMSLKNGERQNVDTKTYFGESGRTNARAILTHISTNSTDQGVRELASYLLKNIGKNANVLVSLGNADGARGKYYSHNHTVEISKASMVGNSVEEAAVNMEQTVIHEIAHAMTVRTIETNKEARKEVLQIFKEYTQLAEQYGIDTGYAAKNVKEFVAEFLGRKAFREALMELPSNSENKSLGQKIIDFIKKNIFGIKETDSFFERANDAISRLIDYSNSIENEYAEEVKGKKEAQEMDEILDEISPSGLLERLREHKRNCGG